MPHKKTSNPMQKLTVLAALCAAAFCFSGHVQAQEYPTKGVSLIVPFPAGGGVDVVGRVVAQKLGEALGQQVLAPRRHRMATPS
jgi:tripartite-type tricarboxylate transporter receptor subunit TctC